MRILFQTLRQRRIAKVRVFGYSAKACAQSRLRNQD